TGVSANHTFAADGEYDVTLTVTDDDGATASVTQRVLAENPPPGGTLGRDTFSRTQGSGWGSADQGGDWLTAGSTSVSGGAGVLTMTGAGGVSGSRLPGAAGGGFVTSASPTWDKRPAGNGGVTLLRGRISDNGEYRLKMGFKSDGRMVGWLVRTTA